MEQTGKTTKQMLPSGRVLTISLNREQVQRALLHGEIAVYDDRHTDNPSFRIFDSCCIRKNSIKREVIRAMIDYNEANPTEPAWRRTERSLLIEWLEHNFAYRVGFLRSRARNVDLDNHAEGKGAPEYFFKSAWDVIRGYVNPKKR
jgi:hypothetical protein